MYLKISKILSAKTILFFSIFSLACYSEPNPNIKYYGYDWLDSENEVFNIELEKNYERISATGLNNTNLNVVHSIESLNSKVCAHERCALNISAGEGNYYNRLDICYSAQSNTECQTKGSWGNIWNIVANIKSATNKPKAIYFLDEPSADKALQDNGQYVKWQYASYVCTLRQALKAHNLNDVPIFTVLIHRDFDKALPSAVNDILYQMPQSGCLGAKSTPDWVGIDNYNWRHDSSRDDSTVIHETYKRYFSANPNLKWVIVPPSTQESLLIPPVENDQDLHDRIQAYWDYLNAYPQDPVIAVMNFRFDKKILAPSSIESFPKSRALLKFMGNTLTP